MELPHVLSPHIDMWDVRPYLPQMRPAEGGGFGLPRACARVISKADAVELLLRGSSV